MRSPLRWSLSPHPARVKVVVCMALDKNNSIYNGPTEVRITSSSVHELTSRLRDVPTQRLSSSYPFFNDKFNILDGLLVTRAIGHAAWQFRHFGDKTLIFVAPVNHNFITALHDLY